MPGQTFLTHSYQKFYLRTIKASYSDKPLKSIPELFLMVRSEHSHKSAAIAVLFRETINTPIRRMRTLVLMFILFQTVGLITDINIENYFT